MEKQKGISQLLKTWTLSLKLSIRTSTSALQLTSKSEIATPIERSWIGLQDVDSALVSQGSEDRYQTAPWANYNKRRLPTSPRRAIEFTLLVFSHQRRL